MVAKLLDPRCKISFREYRRGDGILLIWCQGLMHTPDFECPKKRNKCHFNFECIKGCANMAEELQC